jgi:lipopolysaccharide transport system ATP-binding protein
MSEPSIDVNNLGKRYRIGELEPYKTLRDALMRVAGHPARAIRKTHSGAAVPNLPVEDDHIWALRNISFKVKQGEAVGIIGPNGAGKSTLLKVLSRITEPTEGSAEIRGRVRALLEVGTGFHMELTGRENVYLNGAILGMRKAEIDRKFDEIVDFSGVTEFINTPVKRYSDGMRVRLGFSIAAHLDPEILLVDEVLAVGDAAFQRKCLGKLGDVTGEGRTIMFVSHDMAAIQNLCSTAYALDHGRVFASGEANDVISRYLESVSRPQTLSISGRTDRQGNGRLRATGFALSGAVTSQDIVRCGAPTTLEIAFQGTPPLRNVGIEVLFYNQLGTCVLLAGSNYAGTVFERVPERGTFLCHFEKLPLMPGIYQLRFVCLVDGIETDDIANAVTLQVVEGDYYGSGKLPEGYGDIAVPHSWEVRPAERNS